MDFPCRTMSNSYDYIENDSELSGAENGKREEAKKKKKKLLTRYTTKHDAPLVKCVCLKWHEDVKQAKTAIPEPTKQVNPLKLLRLQQTPRHDSDMCF